AHFCILSLAYVTRAAIGPYFGMDSRYYHRYCGAAHQAWSANIFSTIGDMFPRSSVATITGIGGMAGGVGSFFINKGSGMLFDYSVDTNLKFMGFQGIDSGYFIIFSICAVSYLIGWLIMKSLV